MVKQQKIISIESDINEHIKDRVQNEGFNFSQWVNDIYRDKFMSIESKQELIDKYNIEISKLNLEINNIKSRNDTILKELTTSEKRFLANVNILVSEGKDYNALRNRYNIDFNRKISLEKFRSIVNIIEEEMRNESRKDK